MPTQAEISLNPTSSKGDLFSYNGSSRTRVPVGTNGQIITAQSSATSGIEWKTYGGASASPTYELIGSSQITTDADSISISNIPQTYQDLLITFKARTPGAWSETMFGIRFNSETSTSYLNLAVGWKSGEAEPLVRENPNMDSSTLATGFGGSTSSAARKLIDTAYGVNDGDEGAYRTLYIPNYTDEGSSSKWKTGIFTMGSPTRVSSTSYHNAWYGVTVFAKNADSFYPAKISSITAYGIENTGTNVFSSGSGIWVYGVRRFGS